MIIPGRHKALVKIMFLRHTYLYVPDQKPELSVAEIVNARDVAPVGTRVLVPTSAGIDISQNGEKLRLINIADIIAILEGGNR